MKNQEPRQALVDGVRAVVENHGDETTGLSQQDEVIVLDMIDQNEDFEAHIIKEPSKMSAKLASEYAVFEGVPSREIWGCLDPLHHAH